MLPPPTAPKERWSKDSVTDALMDGRRLRASHVVDDFTPECLTIEVDSSLSGLRVAGLLERIVVVDLPQQQALRSAKDICPQIASDPDGPGVLVAEAIEPAEGHPCTDWVGLETKGPGLCGLLLDTRQPTQAVTRGVCDSDSITPP